MPLTDHLSDQMFSNSIDQITIKPLSSACATSFATSLNIHFVHTQCVGSHDFCHTDQMSCQLFVHRFMQTDATCTGATLTTYLAT